MSHRMQLIGAAGALAIGIMAFSSPPGRDSQVPYGWTAITDTSYVATTDTGMRFGGKGFSVATLRADREKVTGIAVMQQSIRANQFRGQRVELTGYLKARADEADANLFLRVDGATEVIASDYMETRPVRGRTEWTQYTIVLDVPRNAVGLTFGFALAGSGQVWVDDLSLEVVDASVATTGHPFGLGRQVQRFAHGRNGYENAPFLPINLDFEQKLIALR